MNIREGNELRIRKKLYWFFAVFISIIVVKYGSKYAYLYMYEKECFVDYLRANNFSQKIEYIGQYKGSQSLCYDHMQTIINKHRELRIKDFESNEKDKKSADCMKNRFDNSDIKLDAVYNVFLHLLKNDTKEFTKKELEHHKRLMDSAADMEKLKVDVFFYDCHLDEQLEAEFNILCEFGSKSIAPEHISIAYKCYAEHLKKSIGYFDQAERYLNLPEVPASTCENDAIAPLRDFIKDGFYHQKSTKIFKNNPKFRECFMQKAEDVQIIDKMVTISMRAIFGMDADTKKAEFKTYSEFLEIFKKALYNDCLKNEYF
jgi:hypothetical protein